MNDDERIAIKSEAKDRMRSLLVDAAECIGRENYDDAAQCLGLALDRTSVLETIGCPRQAYKQRALAKFLRHQVCYLQRASTYSKYGSVLKWMCIVVFLPVGLLAQVVVAARLLVVARFFRCTCPKEKTT